MMEGIFEFLKSGLQSEALNKGRSISINRIYILNVKTLMVDFQQKSTFGSDIKMEIFYIMRFIATFGIDNPHFPNQIKNIGVRALNNKNEEAMYAISPLGLLQKKGSIEIEWTKSTIFQENTFEHRLIQAKTIISTLENGLRKLIIERLYTDFGSEWWREKINSKIRKKAEQYFEDQNGYQSSDSTELIKYTFLIDLKKIICTDWVSFRDVLSNKIKFENNMDRLNSIRRDEGHNRNISLTSISELRNIYNSLMADIGKLFPQLVESFLVDNWRIRISEIVSGADLAYKTEDVLSEKNQHSKLSKSILNLQVLGKHCKEIVFNLSTVVVPPNKQSLHNELNKMFEDLGIAYNDMLEAGKIPDFEKLKNAQMRIEKFSTEKNKFISKYLISES